MGRQEFTHCSTPLPYLQPYSKGGAKENPPEVQFYLGTLHLAQANAKVSTFTKGNPPEAEKVRNLVAQECDQRKSEHEDTPPGIGSVRGASYLATTFRGQAGRAQRVVLSHYYIFGSPHTDDPLPPPPS